MKKLLLRISHNAFFVFIILSLSSKAAYAHGAMINPCNTAIPPPTLIIGGIAAASVITLIKYLIEKKKNCINVYSLILHWLLIVVIITWLPLFFLMSIPILPTALIISTGVSLIIYYWKKTKNLITVEHYFRELLFKTFASFVLILLFTAVWLINIRCITNKYF